MDNQHSVIFEHVKSDTNVFPLTIHAHEEKTYIFLLTPKKPMHVDVSVLLSEKQSRVTVYGIIIPELHADVHITTRQVHQNTDSTSLFIFRSLLLSDASVSYNGGIVIGKKAKRSYAFQQHDSMILSPHAKVETRPTLEILNNNVTCKHGTTIQTIPQDILWYAHTRGIGKKQAETLYAQGFIQTIIDKIPDLTIQDLVYNQCKEHIESI